MKAIWPVGTTFRIRSDSGEEVWTVGTEGDPKNGIISFESPFGEFLLGAFPGRTFRFKPLKDDEIELEILSVEPPAYIQRGQEIIQPPVRRDVSSADSRQG